MGNSEDPNECCDFLENTVRKTLDVTCPQERLRVKEIRDPWVTDEILEVTRGIQYLNQAKISGLVEDWVTAKREKNRVGRMVRDASI